MDNFLEMLDEIEEVRQKAAEKPQEYPADFVARVCAAIVARGAGYGNRTEWTEKLKESSWSKYHKRYYSGIIGEGGFHI